MHKIIKKKDRLYACESLLLHGIDFEDEAAPQNSSHPSMLNAAQMSQKKAA